MTQKEYEEKRSKNLCFYCDQKYTPGHKCSGQLFSLEVLGDEEGSESVGEEVVQLEEEMLEHVVEEQTVCPQISLNALAGVNTFHTMRVKGHVGKQVIHILVDSGSTHNFVDIQCAEKLGCPISNMCPLQIDVQLAKILLGLYKGRSSKVMLCCSSWETVIWFWVANG